jgi:hypothetical protein
MFDADINSSWYVCDVPQQEQHAIVASYNIYKSDRVITLVDSKTGQLFAIYDQIMCAPITEKQAQQALADELRFEFDNEDDL